MNNKSLNIKDIEVYRLASELAHETGESMTQVVKEALRARYAQLTREGTRASTEDLMAIAQRIGSKVKGPAIVHGDLLYDENGLPK